MRVLKTSLGEVLDVAFSPDCRAIAAAVKDAGIFLWNLDSPTIAPVRLDADGGYRPGALRFSPSGRELAWQTTEGIRRYNRDRRSTATETFAHLRTAIWWAPCSGGTRLLSAHGLPDHCLARWRFVDDEWVRQWKLSTRELFVGSLTLSPTGDRFAMFTRTSESEPWRLEVRHTPTSEPLTSGSYPYSYAGKLCFSPRGDQIAGLNDMTLLAWSLPTGGEPRRLHNDNRKHFTALAYHPNGQFLYVTSNDETVHVFDTRSLNRVQRYTWRLDRLSTMAISPDGTLAAAGSAAGDVVVWDLE